MLCGHRYAFEDPVVAAMETGLLIFGKVPVLCHFHIVHGDLPGDSLDSCCHLVKRQGDIRLGNDVADSMAQKNLHRDTGIRNLGIRKIHKCSGDAVGQLIRMRRIDFFVHKYSVLSSQKPRITPRLLRGFS